MKTFISRLIALVFLAAIFSGCAWQEQRTVLQQGQTREHGAVTAIRQHAAAVDAVNSPTLFQNRPGGGNCNALDYSVVYNATNGRYDVQSNGGTVCKGGPTMRANIPIVGVGDVAYEDCKEINFSIPECQIYLQKRPGGGQ